MQIIRDSWLVFQRYFGLYLRNPAWVAIGVLQPVLYLTLFAPLLKSLTAVRGFPPGGAYNVFVPGQLIMLGLFGASGVGFGLIAELRLGVIERFRVTPVSRLALLLGRASRDILNLLIQALILILLSLPFGLSIHPVGVLIILVLLALVALLSPSLAYSCALWLKSEDAFAPLMFTATLPLLLLSGVLLPMSLAPAWLRTLALVNPLGYAVDAGRALFLDHVGDVSVVKGLAVMAALALVAVAWAARSVGRAVA